MYKINWKMQSVGKWHRKQISNTSTVQKHVLPNKKKYNNNWVRKIKMKCYLWKDSLNSIFVIPILHSWYSYHNCQACKSLWIIPQKSWQWFRESSLEFWNPSQSQTQLLKWLHSLSRVPKPNNLQYKHFRCDSDVIFITALKVVFVVS